MKKILIATTALTLMCGSAFGQGTTGPATQQDNMTKPGMTNGSMEKDSMKKGSMDKGTTGTGTGTNGFAAKPGGMDKSKPGGQSTARNPGD
jgi:pentapeptide MXKDX repeat protein